MCLYINKERERMLSENVEIKQGKEINYENQHSSGTRWREKK